MRAADCGGPCPPYPWSVMQGGHRPPCIDADCGLRPAMPALPPGRPCRADTVRHASMRAADCGRPCPPYPWNAMQGGHRPPRVDAGCGLRRAMPALPLEGHAGRAPSATCRYGLRIAAGHARPTLGGPCRADTVRHASMRAADCGGPCPPYPWSCHVGRAPSATRRYGLRIAAGHARPTLGGPCRAGTVRHVSIRAADCGGPCPPYPWSVV
jgi:hypothetical protein